MYVSGSGFSTFDASSGSGVYQSSCASSPCVVLKRMSRLYEYDASACVRNVDAFIGSLPSTRLTVPCSVPPGTGLPELLELPPAVAVFVLSPSLVPPLLQPTTATAPAEAPVIAAICIARRREIRLDVTLSQNERFAAMDPPSPLGLSISRVYYQCGALRDTKWTANPAAAYAFHKEVRSRKTARTGVTGCVDR